MLLDDFQSQAFATEEDEANWWDEHQDALVEGFERAAVDGSLRHATVARADRE